jgi:hypothetical protein
MRQGWGLLVGDGEPQVHEVPVRRYRCRRCPATLTVRPEAMARRYLYLVTTIASALWRWSRRSEPARRVRRQLSPMRVVGMACPRRWMSLQRWTRARARLWPGVLGSDGNSSVRSAAAELCGALAAWGDGPFSVDEDGEAAACRGAVARLAM